MLLNYSKVTRLGVNEHPMSRTGWNVHLIAAGHHVQGLPLPFPWRVISVLPCSLVLLNVNGAQAKADAGEKALQDIQSIALCLRVPVPPPFQHIKRKHIHGHKNNTPTCGISTLNKILQHVPPNCSCFPTPAAYFLKVVSAPFAI